MYFTYKHYIKNIALLLIFSCLAPLLGATLTSLAGQAIVNSLDFHPTPIEYNMVWGFPST
jgi:hypothetical protein